MLVEMISRSSPCFSNVELVIENAGNVIISNNGVVGNFRERLKLRWRLLLHLREDNNTFKRNKWLARNKAPTTFLQKEICIQETMRAKSSVFLVVNYEPSSRLGNIYMSVRTRTRSVKTEAVLNRLTVAYTCSW